MADKSEIIKKYPVGRGLDAFRETFSSTCENLGYHKSLDVTQHFDNESLKNLAVDHFHALQNLPTARHLPSSSDREVLRADLLRYSLLAVSDDFDVRLITPLLNAVGKNESDKEIWLKFYELATESTPPPRQLPYPYQTPISFNTGSFVNTSENRKHFDGALRDELDSSLYIDVPDFFDAFFGEVQLFYQKVLTRGPG